MSILSSPVNQDSSADTRCRHLLREAASWRLLGLLFARPRGEWRTQISRLAGEISDTELREAARVAQNEAHESLYDTTFGPGGPAAAREISHRQSAISGQYLADLRGYYDAFGYHSPYDEPPDHIAVEIDFLAYLWLKQAYADARCDSEQSAVTADAARHFVEEHLSMVAAPLAKTLENSGIRYLTLAAAALHRRAAPQATRTSRSSQTTGDALAGIQLPICYPEDCCAEYDDFWAARWKE